MARLDRATQSPRVRAARRFFLLALSVLATSAAAQTPPPAVPEEVVVTASPLPGTAVDPNKIPVNIQTLTSADLERFGASNALNTLADEIAGVSIANAQGNPYQPNLFYRGFEASPLAGDAQGLAVYADGARLNQPFGDTLNWELIPDVAIDQLTLEGSNPVFGLNALGGSISIAMKNGFSFQGTEAEGVVGSFGHFQSSIEYGLQRGNRAFYLAANGVSENGWRQHSPSRLVQLYADAGLRNDNGELHLSLTGAATKLTGNGTAPVELLAVDRSHVFTYPDETKNTYGLANLHGTRRLSGGVSLQGNLYLSRLHQRTRNADATEVEPCVASPGFLCLDDDDLTDVNGDPIPAFLNGGTYSQLNSSATDTTGYGAALQISYDSLIGTRANKLIAGASVDGGRTDFAAQSEIGALGADRGFVGPGIVIDQADQTIAPVKVTSKNDYYGFFVTDVFDVTEAFSLNAAARYNIARIELDDDLGTALNGEHRYARLNPAFGASYEFSKAITVYTGYSEANRAPTPAEFSCADPAAPCSLTNFFVGDPDLKQVVAHSVEVGLRGRSALASGMSLQWHVGLYRTDTSDDIMLVSSSIIGRAFFENVGDTRRQGLESALDIRFRSWSATFNYSYTEATFLTAFTLNSPLNPFADVDGEIHVVKGDRLPSVPAHLFKATIGYEISPKWSFALSAQAASGVYLRGDEANLNPKTDSYIVFNVSSTYRLNDTFEVFGTINNLFNAKYETFGAFSPTSDIPMAEAPGATDPRSLAPAPPLSVFAGVRIHL